MSGVLSLLFMGFGALGGNATTLLAGVFLWVTTVVTVWLEMKYVPGGVYESLRVLQDRVNGLQAASPSRGAMESLTSAARVLDDVVRSQARLEERVSELEQNEDPRF